MRWQQYQYAEENLIDLSFDLISKELTLTRLFPKQQHIKEHRYKAVMNFSDKTFAGTYIHLGKLHYWRGKKMCSECWKKWR